LIFLYSDHQCFNIFVGKAIPSDATKQQRTKLRAKYAKQVLAEKRKEHGGKDKLKKVVKAWIADHPKGVKPGQLIRMAKCLQVLRERVHEVSDYVSVLFTVII
jgi:hypothetical protein